uniref:Tetratricopeptide repeat protein n=1 Tax=Emiliania huxleyi TaxID=2903 RepID=A0A7S3RVE4_EMIHU|mmetsp:Transcript_10024/g.29163  ORF Transcript_10024/g.29163 Transcript_10024/m.29163 type:complete len:180 (+) Transcript_10024:1311-1850(+)
MEPETRASAGRRGRIGRSPDPSRTCPPQDTRRKHNTTVAEHSGPIAAAVLEAELSYREGRLEASWAALADAVARYDAMPYDEPAGYLMPPRQTYAALLAEQGRLERAARLYEEDLGTFPKNVWSLAGLRLCLAGEAHAPRLREVEAALAAAEAAADVEVRASCACALESWGSGRRPAPE